MENLKQTQTITFQKKVSIGGKTSTFAVINLEYGLNKRSEVYRSVNQANTSNSTIAALAKKYEEGVITTDEMIYVIESEGFIKEQY